MERERDRENVFCSKPACDHTVVHFYVRLYVGDMFSSGENTKATVSFEPGAELQ